MNLLTRKELPAWGIIDLHVDINRLKTYCVDKDYINYDHYNDSKYSSGGKFTSYLITHEFSKDNFFKEDTAPSKEGELYKQLYLTEMSSEKIVNSEETIRESSKTMFSRAKRFRRNSANYIAEADELNYTVRNKHVTDVFEEILNMFKSTVTRARLAVLMPNFEIKPHVDYDPSYITRYHIPIFTNEFVTFGVKTKQGPVEFGMPADGSIYFFNSGLLHWVKNLSDEPRLHLIIDTHGQDDLKLK